MGAVLHTLNIRLGEKDLEYIINHAEDQVIIADADILPLLEKMVGKIPTVRQVIVATEKGSRLVHGLPNPSTTKTSLKINRPITIGRRLMKTRRWAFAIPVVLQVILRALNTSIARNIYTP